MQPPKIITSECCLVSEKKTHSRAYDRTETKVMPLKSDSSLRVAVR